MSDAPARDRERPHAFARERDGGPRGSPGARTVTPRSSVLVGVDCRMIHASGIGTYLQNLLPGLMAARPDWSWRLFGNPGALRQFPWTGGPRVETVAFPDAIYTLREHGHWLGQRRPRLSLFWSPHYTVPLIPPAPVVVTIHDLAHLAMPEIFSGLAKQAYARMFMRLARRAAGMIFVSEFTRREFLARIGAPKGPSEITLLGADLAWFHGEVLPRAQERPYLLFIGNVKPHKNLPRLLGAFARLAPDIPHDLVIVGQRDGFITSDTAIEPLVAALGGRARFTGWVGNRELRAWVQGADLLIQPSLYEGFGLSPLEAMASSCPVALSRAASLPEVGGDAALYFDPYDVEDIAGTIRRAVTDRALNAQLRAAGRARAATFRWDRAAALTAALFEAARDGQPASADAP